MLETRKKILCIEDDRETAGLIAEELIERGYAVDLAYDGREGFSAILRTEPDLVLADIAMPFLSGFELLARLTEIAPRLGDMPFVFLTAFTDRDIELRARQAGADDFVTKPVDFDLLYEVIVARLLRAPRNEAWPKGSDM